MAWRIHDSVVRGEIDNRVKGIVRGKIWLHRRKQPVTLEVRGNAHPDLAGCLLKFKNPKKRVADSGLASLNRMQRGTIGDLTASRKVRVFDIPLAEALAMLRRKEKPPEHLANSLYLEWFSDANGRVVIESADYELEISAPEWRLTAAEEKQRAQDAAEGLAGFIGKLTQALEEKRFTPPEDRPMTEFEWEKSFRESDALTDKYMELLDKYGHGPEADAKISEEMGWTTPAKRKEAEAKGKETQESEEAEEENNPAFDVDEMNRICAEAEANPPKPNPLTEGVDWIPDDWGGTCHPLERRIIESSQALWHWCNKRKLLGEGGDRDLHDMIFKLQCCGAKCAGALGGLAYDDIPDSGFIVAGLKRALALLNESLKFASRVKKKKALPPEKLGPFEKELFAIREEILRLMERFRKAG